MIVAFDTETKGLDWWDPNQQAFLGSYAYDSPDGPVVGVCNFENPDDVGEFVDVLKKATVLVAHNMPFDVHQVRETLGLNLLELSTPLHDTHIMAKVALPAGQSRPSYKLKDLAQTYVSDNAKEDEDEMEKLAKQAGIKLKTTGGFYDFWRAYPEVLERYAGADAELTLHLYGVLRERLHGNQAWELEQRVTPVLIQAEATGVRIEPSVVLDLEREYDQQLDISRDRLLAEIPEQALGGPGSKQALAEGLLACGVPLSRKTTSGQLRTDKYVLDPLKEQYPVVKNLSDFRTAEKFLSTYIEPMKDRDVVHTNFGQCDAWTGRMSSYRPNMQNIPVRSGAQVRAMFVPREGHSFVVADYDSIEVRLLAYYMGRQEYRDLISQGHDPHAWMAAQIHGGRMEDYEKGTEGEGLRAQAKNTMFAITYGAGAPRVADMNTMSVADAKVLIKKIKTALPGYYKLNERIRKKIEAEGHVNTLFGRKQPVAKDKAYVGLNALIQGSAADIMKQGLVNVQQNVQQYGATPLLVVHDEVVVETPTEHAEEVCGATIAGMVSAYELDPQLAVSYTTVTTSYADAK